jgi:predicted RNase H-like nuclease
VPSPEAPQGRFLGLDLAWGERARTGVAILDATGALLRSTTAGDDDDLARILGDDAARAVIVAIDAPLLVPNATGRRSCEASVAREFARFDAGPYPSNRGMAAFRDGSRGARLARRLDWRVDGDPGAGGATTGRPLAIEVYPHPAMVVLFGLDRVLPYKARPGRSLAVRREALRTAMANLERVGDATLRLSASDRWDRLTDDVRRADRPVDLKRAEDEVDAILCGYLAWLWHVHPGRLVRYGDGTDGYILVPRAS